MKITRILMLFPLIIMFSGCFKKDVEQMALEDYPTYDGTDLGLSKVGDRWTFKVWSPVADKMLLKMYNEGVGGEPVKVYEMAKDRSVWKMSIHQKEEVEGKFYTFQAKFNETWRAEAVDPYVKAVGVNGQRGYVQLPSEADPDGWETDRGPELRNMTDAVIYELHIRDFSIDPSSGMTNRGKYRAFTEVGTKSPGGVVTGIDHLQELGITHVHLLPTFDYRSVDESRLEEPQFNWGYDPQNYNVPEGSYASDPHDPMLRIREFKEMVMSLHKAGIRVIMDVVYNHTGATESSLFNQLVPDYYYRFKEDGTWSDAAACGNEVASERVMVRKFIVESVRYWVEEYHIDGFRFDLMGIHDIETMNQLSRTLKAVDPSIILYGEGWTAGPSPLPDSLRALKANTHLLDQIAAFSDDLRDGIKGSVFEDLERGFVTGLEGTAESIKFGVVAGTQHSQVDYQDVNYSNAPWAGTPEQCINYVSCHDNLTLWDKLMISQPEGSVAERMAMAKLANTIVLLSQGVPFLHGGVELLRTKDGEHNSYKSPDAINSLKWDRKAQYQDVYQYYQRLITLRRNHPAFRMTSTMQIQEHLEFMKLEDPLLVGFWLKDNANGDDWRTIGVIFNGSSEEKELGIPSGPWTIVLSGGSFEDQIVREELLSIPPKSAVILHD